MRNVQKKPKTKNNQRRVTAQQGADLSRQGAVDLVTAPRVCCMDRSRQKMCETLCHEQKLSALSKADVGTWARRCDFETNARCGVL